MSDVEVRVKRLEEDGKEIRADLKTIMRDLAEIKASMATKTELADVRVAVGKLEARVDRLPSFTKMGVLTGVTIAAVTIITRWSEISAALGWSPLAS